MALWGCDDSIERNIERLNQGGEEAEAARKRLNKTKPIDTMALIRAFRTKDHPPPARVDMAEALYQVYLREEDRRVLAALIEGLNDPDAAVRTKVASALGDLGQEQAVAPLVDQLVGEGNDAARYQMLVALEALGREDGPVPFSSRITSARMSAEDNMRFSRVLVQMTRENLSDSLRLQTREWLEVLAAEKALEAHTWVEKGDRQWAEKLLLAARDQIPDSKNINWQLGRFYCDHGDREKGLRTLDAAGLLARVHRMHARPRIDGVLEKPAWQNIAPLTRFYQCLWNQRAYPVAGDAEIYLGYYDSDLYIGFKGYEPSTHNLAAAATQRDDDKVSRDDVIEIFLDANHDYQTYYHILVNSIGTVVDQYNDGTHRQGDLEWDGSIAVAVALADTFWTVEIQVPVHRLDSQRLGYGAIWGFNFARVRVANSSTYAQWAPTYGSAHRPDRFGFLVFD